MEVILKCRAITEKRKAERDLYWYDSVAKKMQHFRGGQLRFAYDPVSKRSYPIVEDVLVNATGNNYNKIVQWVSQNSEHYGLSVTARAHNLYVIVEVGADRINEMEEDLYRHNILCDYSAREQKLEMKKR